MALCQPHGRRFGPARGGSLTCGSAPAWPHPDKTARRTSDRRHGLQSSHAVGWPLRRGYDRLAFNGPVVV